MCAQTKPAILTVQVGVIAPLTGHSAYFGRVVRNGIVISFNEAELGDVKFALDVQDDAGDPDRDNPCAGAADPEQSVQASGRAIQLLIGIAGKTQPSPATT